MSMLVILKLIHVLAAITAVGANLTYTYWMRYAGQDRDRLIWTMKGIRRLDNFIATPAYVVLLITGVLMVIGGVFSFQTGWIVAAIALYVVVVVFHGARTVARLRPRDDAGVEFWAGSSDSAHERSRPPARS